MAEPRNSDSTEEGVGGSDLRADHVHGTIRWIPIVVAALGLLFVISSLWWLGSSLTSAEQRAADALPPPARPVVVPVEWRELVDTVVVRGDVKPSEHGLLEVQWSGTSEGIAVISAPLPELGETISEGGVVAEVSGRPIFLMEGQVPLWRELGSGDQGRDVVALQGFLVRLGASIGDEPGIFGPATASAVARFYEDVGYPPMFRESPSSGPIVPFGEVVVIQAAPAYVAAVTASLGGTVGGPILTLASSELVVESLLDPQAANLIEVGAAAFVESETTGNTATGRVASIAPNSETTPQGRTGHRTVIAVDGGLEPNWLGLNVRVTITDASTGQPALVVPESALYAQADGLVRVVVQTDAGTFVEVPVRVGMTAGGFAVVTSSDDAVHEGALVVVSGDWRSAQSDTGQK